jgi:anti-sigma B factor antagonist
LTQSGDIPAEGREFEVRADEASDKVTVLKVIGELDLSTNELLREPLVGAAEAGRSVVVDLSECEFVDSSGIRALLIGHEAATGNGEGGRQVVLAQPQPQVMRVLDMTGVGEAVPIHESVDEALEQLG